MQYFDAWGISCKVGKNGESCTVGAPGSQADLFFVRYTETGDLRLLLSLHGSKSEDFSGFGLSTGHLAPPSLR